MEKKVIFPNHKYYFDYVYPWYIFTQLFWRIKAL